MLFHHFKALDDEDLHQRVQITLRLNDAEFYLAAGLGLDSGKSADDKACGECAAGAGGKHIVTDENLCRLVENTIKGDDGKV